MIDLKQIKNTIIAKNTTESQILAFKLINVFNNSNILELKLANSSIISGQIIKATHMLLVNLNPGESGRCTDFMIIDNEQGISGLTPGNIYLGANGDLSYTPTQVIGDLFQKVGFIENSNKVKISIEEGEIISNIEKSSKLDIITGTNDINYITPKGLKDSGTFNWLVNQTFF